MTETVRFGEHVISDFFTVVGVQRPPVSTSNTFTEVSGMDGARMTDSKLGQATAKVFVMTSDKNLADMREAVRRLCGMIYTDEPKVLSFSSDNGRYYKAVLDGEVPFVEHTRSGLFELNFVTESPTLYGSEKSVTVPSGGSVTISVGGTYPTCPVIEGSVYGSGANTLWGLRLDEGDYIRISTGSTSARNVMIDCENARATVSSAVKLPILGSDWLELTPRVHTIRNDVGSGSCTLRWTERWL